jgi:exonuclease III
MALDGEWKKPPFAMTDTFRTVYPDEEIVTTFNAFQEFNPRGHKIDYIFVTEGLKAADAEIIRTKTPTERYPTDHFPVRAVLTF